NKSHLDLGSQLRLFVAPEENLGIRPERQLEEIGELEFVRRHQCGVSTLPAFEKSEHPDDWRELMRRYMVRRTRGFIQAHYTELDEERGRRYLTLADGTRSYFPVRQPLTRKFRADPRDPADPYARLYSDAVVGTISGLALPRYGLGNYERSSPDAAPNAAEAKVLAGLGRAGKRLIGFSRTNLFKRLESGGPAFLQSLERHALRNFVFLHAIEHGLDLPLGTKGADLLDLVSGESDAELEPLFAQGESGDGDDTAPLDAEAGYRRRAAVLYDLYHGQYARRFTWLRPSLFTEQLRRDLQADADMVLELLNGFGAWEPAQDAKLDALVRLLTEERPRDKVLVFTQFADTVDYLSEQLRARGLTRFAAITGDSENPTELVWRFSPESNGKRDRVSTAEELRVLIATDVLSEGQNLQDCHVVVNYDLPWAIIRLIQRAGRVDRIGQRADTIFAYSFLPPRDWSASSGCAGGFRSACARTRRWWARTRCSLNMKRRPSRSLICTTRTPASWTATAPWTVRWTWRPRRTRSGRTRRTRTHRCGKPSRSCPTWCFPPAPMRAPTPNRRACCSTCAPRMTTTRSPGWTGKAGRSRSPSSASWRWPAVSPIRPPCRTLAVTTSWCAAAWKRSSPRAPPRAGSWGAPRGLASASTSV
ncbi:MAG: SWF/SNF helicase family protein, partial [Gemmatimonadota bacterium]|nr:SWF/SNF helicase family protein [Gemmatimonadota bacterium]